MSLNTIEEALIDLKNGKMIIVVDDENRENEGDFILPAETVTPEIINFMAIHGRGLICVPLTSKRCKQLGLNHMVDKNTEFSKQCNKARRFSKTWSHISPRGKRWRCFEKNWTY